MNNNSAHFATGDEMMKLQKWEMKRRIITFIIGTNWLFLEYVSFNSHLSFCHQTKPMQSTIPHTSLETFVWYVYRNDDTDTIHLQWKWEEVLKVIKSDQSTANRRGATIWNCSYSLLSKPKYQFDSEMRLLKFPARTLTPKTKPRWVGGSLALPDEFSLFTTVNSRNRYI